MKTGRSGIAGRFALVLAAALVANGCASGRPKVGWPPWEAKPPTAEEVARTEEREAERARAEARAKLPSHPAAAEANSPGAEKVRAAALTDRHYRIVVSTRLRALWLMRGDSAEFIAPVAVGMNEDFTWAGKRYDFDTPHGRRRVISKQTSPLWVPPDWHYFEKAAEKNLKPVQLGKKAVVLGDSTRLEVRGDQVGRVNQFGNFWPFDPGVEIIFDGKIYIPPLGSAQRKVPAVLGTHKLEIGNGYLIHGTNQETSIGDAVSHGCVRMYNADVATLYDRVPVGTPVYIF